MKFFHQVMILSCIAFLIGCEPAIDPNLENDQGLQEQSPNTFEDPSQRSQGFDTDSRAKEELKDEREEEDEEEPETSVTKTPDPAVTQQPGTNQNAGNLNPPAGAVAPPGTVWCPRDGGFVPVAFSNGCNTSCLLYTSDAADE